MYTHDNTNQFTLPIEVDERIVPTKEKRRVFQSYDNRQLMMILDIEQYIPETHLARAVNEMVESIPDETLMAHYVGGGRAPYHPKMMLKIILYAYTQKVYSSRNIAQMVKENLPMMWLAAMQMPDHRTINDFRGVRMPNMVEDVFEQLILQLLEEGVIDLEYLFVDGTKIEANANKYSFVWKKSVQNFDRKLRDKIALLVKDVQAVTAEEMKTMSVEQQIAHTTDALEEHVTKLEEAIVCETDVATKKQLRKEKTGKKQQIKAIQEDYLPRLAKYEGHYGILGERNSYSKTDHDATFMRMKDDHMRNGQLKAAYNIQAATQHQFIVGFDIFQRPGDTRCFQPFMEKLRARKRPAPEIVIADAGYASEANYLYALGQEDPDETHDPRFTFVAPYQTYRKEQKRSFKKEIKNVKNWTYIEEDDYFICPNNRRVPFKKYMKKNVNTGHTQDFKVYECEDCHDCPLKALCTKAKGNRQVHWNTIYEELKAKAKAALEDDKLSALYAQRKVDVESMFGNLKGNLSFTRFLLRGLTKVRTEFALVAMAHNLRKWVGHRLHFSVQTEKSGFGKHFVFQIRFYFGLIGQP
ncbi:MAG: IS1182 family transposase, partial [Caryophanon sp.]|nr:IS1182 family transposase [Caryophanon sp.]